MASKRGKSAEGDDNIDELFQGIGNEAGAKKQSQKTKAAAKSKPDSAPDPLAELESQLDEKPTSRPHTPRIKESAALPGQKGTPASGRASEDRPGVPRKSVESARSFHASFTPSATGSELQESEQKDAAGEHKQSSASAAGGGWWGGWSSNLISGASAAMKQAEAAVSQIQQNDEARKWADQVRTNAGLLRGLGDDLRQRAMPTFANLLQTLAPPISSHERLLIHITHDFVGYPSLDPLIHEVFSRVMSQVEGGDLLVIQRGHESSIRSPGTSDRHPFPGSQSTAGWRDGPWWRATDAPRDLGLVKGLTEGTKLCRASAEGYANDFFSNTGGVEGARERAAEPLSEDSPVRSSDLFLSVQAISQLEDKALFSGSSSEKDKEEGDSKKKEDGASKELVCFAVYIHDPVHNIQFHSVSQALPARWVRWLDTSSVLTPSDSGSDDDSSSDNEKGEKDKKHTRPQGDDEADLARVPEDIRDIVEGGGVDPREWVAEWIEETLSLSVGVVAQRYVAKRMGVGEGGLGHVRKTAQTIMEEGGGEIARAGLI